jgi:hypothetical protein
VRERRIFVNFVEIFVNCVFYLTRCTRSQDISVRPYNDFLIFFRTTSYLLVIGEMGFHFSFLEPLIQISLVVQLRLYAVQACHGFLVRISDGTKSNKALICKFRKEKSHLWENVFSTGDMKMLYARTSLCTAVQPHVRTHKCKYERTSVCLAECVNESANACLIVFHIAVEEVGEHSDKNMERYKSERNKKHTKL